MQSRALTCNSAAAATQPLLKLLSAAAEVAEHRQQRLLLTALFPQLTWFPAVADTPVHLPSSLSAKAEMAEVLVKQAAVKAVAVALLHKNNKTPLKEGFCVIIK
jgi:hypothetical protein